MGSQSLEHYAAITKRFARITSEAPSPEALSLLIKGHRTILGRSSLSPNTVRTYERAFEDLLIFFPNNQPLHQLGVAEAKQFVSFLQSPKKVTDHTHRGRRRTPKGLRKSTITVRITAARSVFSVFVWAGMIVRNPFDQVIMSRPEKKSQAQLSYYRRVELIEMLAVASVHDQCLILLGAHAGLRSRELYSLRWDQISLTQQIIEMRPASIHISNQLTLALQHLHEHQLTQSSRLDFVLELRTQYGLYQRLRNVCLAAGVEFRGVQALRNTCGRTLLIQTGDARLVQEHLRLRSLEQVDRYSTQDVKARSAVAAMQF